MGDKFSDVKTIKDTFNDPEFSDCEVHVGGKVFKVSKYLLCIHSAVFHACFRNETKEKQTGVIEIKDLEPNLVEQMLRFMYQMDVENLDEIAHDLFVVSERYLVKGLMNICIESIENNIDQSTLQKCIDLSTQLFLPSLQEKSVNFIFNELKEEKNVEEMKLLLEQNGKISWNVLEKAMQEIREANRRAATFEQRLNRFNRHNFDSRHRTDNFYPEEMQQAEIVNRLDNVLIGNIPENQQEMPSQFDLLSRIEWLQRNRQEQIDATQRRLQQRVENLLE